MNPYAQKLKEDADRAKYAYHNGFATYDEMKEACEAYINYANERAKEIAKQYGMKPRRMSVRSYMR